jgi:multidrug efflux pump subunit AcrA (membrane-fusion protein)
MGMIFHNRRMISVSLLALAMTSCGRTRPEAKDTISAPVISVRVQRPDRIQRPVFVSVSGTVEAAQRADLGFQIPGRVARVLVDEGQTVRQGQVLAELDAVDYEYVLQASEGQAGVAQAAIEKAQAGTRPEELEQARAAYDRAENEYQAYRRLYERKSMAPVDFAKVEAAFRVAKAQYEMAQNGARREDRAAAGSAVKQAQAQVDASRKHIADTHLVSPINGIVSRRGIDPGGMVSSAMPVFSILDLNPARVRVGIPEMDIGRIRAGQAARIAIPALMGSEFKGTVELVGVAADPNSRTFTAKIAVPNSGLKLKAGMIAEAIIETSGTVNSVVIPGEAVVHDPQGGTLVYVYYPDRKRVHARRVETGPVRDRGVEVSSGLSGDELVVVAGQYKLREGSPVEVMQ